MTGHMTDPLQEWKIETVEWHVEGHPVGVTLRGPEGQIQRLSVLIPTAPPEEVAAMMNKLDPVGRLMGAALAEMLLSSKLPKHQRVVRIAEMALKK